MKRERNLALLDLQDRITEPANRALVGTEVRTLLDERSRTDPSRLSGRTPGNRLVHVLADASLVGRLANVRITDATAHSLRGDLLSVD